VDPIGFAGFWSWDGVGDAPQLLYALKPEHTRRGYAGEAAVAMIDFARAQRSLGHIDAAVDEPNEASWRLLEKLGFARNGEAPGAFGRMFRYRLAQGRPPLMRRTERLIMRPFRADDLAPFAALNSDPRVMEFFPAPLTRAESDALAERITQHFERHGFSAWALELPGVAPFIGFTGLGLVGFESHFTPATELAYRIAAEHWGQGYASEAARAALEVAFVHLELEQVVAFTAALNVRSQRVMERLGMRRDPRADFDHPRLPAGHPLARHVLYRVAARSAG
jgi:ribosomal-protein-alanine N-acetyltransferase